MSLLKNSCIPRPKKERRRKKEGEALEWRIRWVLGRRRWPGSLGLLGSEGVSQRQDTLLMFQGTLKAEWRRRQTQDVAGVSLSYCFGQSVKGLRKRVLSNAWRRWKLDTRPGCIQQSLCYVNHSFISQFPLPAMKTAIIWKHKVENSRNK